MDQATELKGIAPASAFVEKVTVKSRNYRADEEVVNEHTYYLRQFGYKDFFRVLPHANSIYAAIKALNIDLDSLLKGFEGDPFSIIEPILQVSAVVGEDVAALTALAIGKPVDYLNTLDPADGVQLTIAVFKVNIDFFVQTILPMLEKMKGATEAETAIATDGATL